MNRIPPLSNSPGIGGLDGLDGLKKSPELIVRHPQRVSYLKV